MIMSGTLSNISPRLHEVNVLLSTCGQGSLSFGQALLLSLFYRDFSDTNIVVEEAELLVERDLFQSAIPKSKKQASRRLTRPLAMIQKGIMNGMIYLFTLYSLTQQITAPVNPLDINAAYSAPYCSFTIL